MIWLQCHLLVKSDKPFNHINRGCIYDFHCIDSAISITIILKLPFALIVAFGLMLHAMLSSSFFCWSALPRKCCLQLYLLLLLLLLMIYLVETIVSIEINVISVMRLVDLLSHKHLTLEFGFRLRADLCLSPYDLWIIHELCFTLSTFSIHEGKILIISFLVLSLPYQHPPPHTHTHTHTHTIVNIINQCLKCCCCKSVSEWVFSFLS